MSRPILVLTQGDPSGIGPEILLRLALGEPAPSVWQPLLVAERAALEPLRDVLPELAWDRLVYLDETPDAARLAALDASAVAVVDPVGERRQVPFGRPGAADGGGALAALDLGVELVRDGPGAALVTAPLAKGVIARFVRPGFVGHTDYLAEGCGLERYGRDYLMAFLVPPSARERAGLQVALHSTHLPLREALSAVDRESVGESLACLHRHAPGRIALAGLNPHAGEGGLLGTEEEAELAPAVAAARASGIDVQGPESADSLFARARRGEFDWVLALYHDQGLIAVKTAAFGLATNWTLGLPYLRTSVDHGTAFAIAGRGLADPLPLAAAVETTLAILAGDLPRGS